MSDQHRATDSEWYCVKTRGCGSKADVVAYSTIHELLCRIMALEATQHAHADASHVTDPEREEMAQVREVAASIRAAAHARAKPNHPEIPNSSLERRVSEHIRAHSVITAALVKRLEALEGVPLDGAVPAKVPGGLPALAEKVKALEDTVNATTQPSHPKIPDSSLMGRVAAVIENGTACDRASERIAGDTILEVADWLRENPDVYFAPALVFVLEKEAER